MRNMFEVSFTEEITVSVKSIFEMGFKFSASEERNKLYSTESADRGEIGERLWSYWGASDFWRFMTNKK